MSPPRQWRLWKTAEEKAVEFSSTRVPQKDEEFLEECGIPNNADAKRIALAVRRSVGVYGMVDPSYIRVTDRHPGELSALTGWDSIDFVDWKMRLEEMLGEAIPNEAWNVLKEPFSVRDLVLCVYYAPRRPLKQRR